MWLIFCGRTHIGLQHLCTCAVDGPVSGECLLPPWMLPSAFVIARSAFCVDKKATYIAAGRKSEEGGLCCDITNLPIASSSFLIDFLPRGETMWPPCLVSTAGFISEWEETLCIEMANHERNKKILLELVRQPDNSLCADCGAPGKQSATDSLYMR